MKKLFGFIKLAIIYPVLISLILVMMALRYNTSATIFSIIILTVLSMILIRVTMCLHEYFHGIAYKITDKSADIVISMKGSIKSIWNKSNTWYTKKQMLFVLLFPFFLSFALVVLGFLMGLIRKPFAIAGYCLALLNFAGMTLDIGQSLSIAFDTKHRAFKYAPNAKLLRS